MRLIDADKVIQSIDRQMNMARELLSNKPQSQEFVSIAEQSFKQEISNAPTVEAIPIDWIEKWVVTTNMGAGRTIDRLLEDWEKENTLDKQIEQWEIDDDVDWEMIQNGEITD